MSMMKNHRQLNLPAEANVPQRDPRELCLNLPNVRSGNAMFNDIA